MKTTATASMPSARACSISGLTVVELRHGLDRAVGAHAFFDLDHALVELFGKDDLLGEDVRARLVGDLQRVAEPLGDQQQDAVALAFQQRIGGDRGAHLDVADAMRGDGLAGTDAEQVADALHGGVAVGFRVLGEQLAGVEVAFGVATDDVRESAAAIDPEIPFPVHRPSSRNHGWRFPASGLYVNQA